MVEKWYSLLSEKANGSGFERFCCTYISDKTHNDVSYRKCEEHVKCKRYVSTAEEEKQPHESTI